jgi:hypothetical protein
VPVAWSAFIRKSVLGVILARAGLSMVSVAEDAA